MVIGIIGGGASGMAAALEAARQPDTQVILMERQARLGRKLLATGNGRCNLSNRNAAPEHYHGTDPAFVIPALTRFSAEKTLDWFDGLGLYTVTEPSGRVYPYSDQANSVLDVLRFALDQPNITQKPGFEVEKVKRSGSGFQISAREEQLFADRLIVACGGLAGTRLGGSMSGYQLLRALGHPCSRLRPTLVQLKTDWPGITALKGVRANCCARILRDGSRIAESCGELQFTEYGLSGPVIFEISRDACQGGGEWSCRLDLLPELEETELIARLARNRNREASELLTGIVHNRLGRVLVQHADVRLNTPAADLTDADLRRIARTVKAFEISLEQPLGMDSAQVTAGGILTDRFDPETLESRLVPNLYACGEVLDIDGDCGGYNLQWAWSSGRLAGQSAGRNHT